MVSNLGAPDYNISVVTNVGTLAVELYAQPFSYQCDFVGLLIHKPFFHVKQYKYCQFAPTSSSVNFGTHPREKKAQLETLNFVLKIKKGKVNHRLQTLALPQIYSENF